MKILEVKHLSKNYEKKDRLVDALKPIDFSLSKGQIMGLIGESGSGKSTILKLLTGLEKPTAGKIWLLGKEITNLTGKDAIYIYQHVQMIFQNPITSFNPRKKLSISLLENMQQLCQSLSFSEQKQRMDELLTMVGISKELTDRYPHQLSGGQCQRLAIARALSVRPKVLLCDEVTSALDVSAQARVIHLLSTLNKELGIAIIFVSHDLSLASSFCHYIMVLRQGECIESGETKEIFYQPKQLYTKQLLQAVIDPETYLNSKAATRS